MVSGGVYIPTQGAIISVPRDKAHMEQQTTKQQNQQKTYHGI